MDELQIIKYLDGEMNSDEKDRFEQEVRLNQELADELEKYRQVQDLAMELLSGVQDPGLDKEIRESVIDFRSDPSAVEQVPDDYREILMDAERKLNKLPRRHTKGTSMRRVWVAAAALVILAMSLYILIYQPFKDLTSDELYSQYFSPLTQTGQIREMARADNDFLFAVKVYESGDYERAAILFDLLIDRPGTRSWSILYASSSHLLLHQTDRAIELLQGLGSDVDPGIAETATWQLALAYLKAGDTGMAGKELEELAGSGRYSRKSRQILRILR